MTASASGPRVLVVEDDADFAALLRERLWRAGYGVDVVPDGERALEAAAVRAPDVVLLDLLLPGLHGCDVCRRLREWTGVPILVLSALTSEAAKIEALDAGADDYLTKPFGWGELLARMQVALRRAPASRECGQIRFGDVEIDLVRRQVRRGGTSVPLTDTEYRLLCALARRPGHLVPHDTLLAEVWGPGARERHRIRFHLAALRRKLEPEPRAPRHLLTEPGAGCRLRLDAS